MSDQIVDVLARSAELRQRSAEACTRMKHLRLHMEDLKAFREKLQVAWDADWETCLRRTRAAATPLRQ
jgi:hypothetical protein